MPPAPVSRSSPYAPPSPPYTGGYDRRLRDARNGGQSTYDGRIALTLLDRDLVAAILPPVLQLAEPSPDRHAPHPVLTMLGTQADLRWLVDGAALPSGVAPYRELILLVPYTVHRGHGDRWHSFAARMYLDNPAAVQAGNDWYAYAKQSARLDIGATESTVRRDDGAALFESSFVTAGPWLAADAAAQAWPGFAALRQIFEMPVVGRGRHGAVCSYFEFDDAHAEVAAARSAHRYARPFRDGMDAWVALGTLVSAPDGAYAVRGLRWRLALERPYAAPNQPPACRIAGVSPP